MSLPQHSVEIVAQVKCHKAVAEEFVQTHGAETARRVESKLVVSAQNVKSFHHGTGRRGIASLQNHFGNAKVMRVEIL